MPHLMDSGIKEFNKDWGGGVVYIELGVGMEGGGVGRVNELKGL